MSKDPNRTPTRREAIRGLGASLAAAPLVMTAAAGQAQPQQQQQPQQNSTGTRPSGLRDPCNSHPKPPFKVQQQPWPGLAGKMNPRPDHGATSYVGSGRLSGRKALITGGDSGMGRAAAIAYAREGADVAINYLPAEEPDAREVVDLIRKAGRKAVAIPGDSGKKASASTSSKKRYASSEGWTSSFATQDDSSRAAPFSTSAPRTSTRR